MPKKFFIIFKSEIKRQFNIEKKYKISIISDLIVYYSLFMLLYLSVKSNLGTLSKEAINLKISIQIISYISWFFFSLTINFISNTISGESTQGTIEQLFISQNSINKILITRFLVVMLRNLLLLIPLTIILVISTRTKVLITLDTLLIFFIMIFGIFGLSLILGGLQLYYKNIGQIPFIMTILFLGSALFDMSNLPIYIQKSLYVLPFAKGVDLIKQSVMPLTNVSIVQLCLLTINSVFYLIIGIILFNYFINKSKHLGRVGTY